MIKKQLIILIPSALAFISLIAGAVTRLFVFQAAFVALFALAFDLKLILLCLSPRKKRAVFAVLAASLSLLIAIAGISFITVQIKIYKAPLQAHSQKVDCVVLLGTKAKLDSSPGELLSSRIRTAAEYLQNNSTIPVIVCGGKSDENLPDEASVMKKELEKLGIASSRIITENTSLSTEENLINAKKLSQELFPEKSPKLLVITSDFHIYRASLYCRALELDASFLASDSQTDLLSKLNCLFREYAAIMLFWLGD